MASRSCTTPPTQVREPRSERRVRPADGIACETVARADLPEGWRDTPPPEELREFGTRWLEARRAAVLFVPSAIVPDEPNVLLSPDHPHFARVTTRGPLPFDVDPRLMRR